MAGEWRIVTVQDIKASSENALSTGPFGSSISSRFFVDSGVPVIRGSNLSEDVGIRLNDEDLVFLTTDKAKEFSRSTVHEGDLVFTCWGTVNQVGLVDSRAAYRKYVISNKQMKLTPDPAKADSLFLYYLFSGPEFQGRIKNQVIGSSVPGFNLGQLRAMELQLPELDEQRAIAHILGTLDDKIELNRRMNETLEAMARALFRSWFVAFDPVRARAEGRNACLPKSIADLFPDSFEDSDLGEIPRGWRVASLGDLVEFAYGKALKEENRQSGQIPVFGSNGQVGWHNEKLTDGPGIIVGRKGNPGIVMWAPTDFFAIDTTFYVVPRGECPSLHFLYYALRGHDLASLGADSAVPGLNRNMAYMSKQVVPSLGVTRAFDDYVQPFFKRRHDTDKESRTLVGLRDTLLPRLISGDLRVT